MEYFSAMLSGFTQIFQVDSLFFLFIGAAFGMIIGVIPGVGGNFAMAMIIPFMYGMEPAAALVFILAAHGAVSQGGGVTTILFSIPGGSQNVATLFDGPALTRKGKGGLAIGAAMTSGFLGALYGSIVLVLLLPVLKKAVLMFGPGEFFMLGVLCLSFVSILSSSERSPFSKGLISALLGVTLSFTGMSVFTTEPRFTYGLLQLWEGIPLVATILGLFSIGELIELWVKRTSFATGDNSQPIKVTYKDTLQGAWEAIKRWKVVGMASAIGSVFGVLPGLGSSSAAFVAYGQAKKSSKHPETFGTGELDGVIAPEAANNGNEGGSLATTIAFGIPGSSSAAILLSAFLIIGLQPGLSFMSVHLDLVFVMIGTIILSNLIGAIVGIGISKPLVKLTTIDYRILVPVFVVIIYVGALAFNGRFFDLLIMLVLGTFGYYMKEFGFSRASFLLGFVLGEIIERNLYLSLELKGAKFLLDPITMVLFFLVLFIFVYSARDMFKSKRKEV